MLIQITLDNERMSKYQNNINKLVDNVVEYQLPDLVDLVLDEKWKIPSCAVNFILDVNKKIALDKNFDFFEAAIGDSNHEEFNFEEDDTLMPCPIFSALSESPSDVARNTQCNISTGNKQSTPTAPKILVEDMVYVKGTLHSFYIRFIQSDKVTSLCALA